MVASHISSDFMHSRMFVHVSIAFMFMLIWGISSSLFSLWLCLDIQSTMNNCGPGFYRVLMLYLCMYRSIFCSQCDRLATSFFEDFCWWFVICYHTTLKQSSSSGTSLGHGGCLVLLCQCCPITFLHW